MLDEDDQTLMLRNMQQVLQKTEEDAKHSNACLLGVGGDLNGTLLDLKAGVTKFGRAKDTSYSLSYEGISRYHFFIEVNGENGRAKIRDMGSSNGTYLNNKKIVGSVELSKGDVIKLGAVAFQYIPPGDPERLTYEKLSRAANVDELTGCYNKTFFLKALDSAVSKAEVTNEPLSLIVFDIDFFKKLNDGYGHDAGDSVLEMLGKLVRRTGVREGDVIARYGGEEFVVLLAGKTLGQASRIAERIREMVENHQFTYDLSRLHVTISLGAAQFDSNCHHTGKDLFRAADNALYRAKENGRNQVQSVL